MERVNWIKGENYIKIDVVYLKMIVKAQTQCSVLAFHVQESIIDFAVQSSVSSSFSSSADDFARPVLLVHFFFGNIALTDSSNFSLS